MKLLAMLNKSKKRQALKERILKNREAVLGAMAQSIKGARQCPFLLGEKCIGQLCELFMEWEIVNDNEQKTKFWRCTFVQQPLLQVETNRNIIMLINEIKTLLKKIKK